MTKKQNFWNNTKIILLILLLVSVFTIWACYLISSTQFNPEKYVCYGNYKEYQTAWHNGYVEVIDTNGLVYGGIVAEHTFYGCEKDKWRPKNKCELNPKSDGCICTEYTDYSRNLIINASNQFEIQEGDWGKFSIRYLYQMNCTHRYYAWYCNVTTYSGDNMPSTVAQSNCHTIYDYYINETCEKIWDVADCSKAYLPPQPIEIQLVNEKCNKYTNETKFCKELINNCNEEYSYFVAKTGERPNTCNWYDKHCCIQKEPKTECEKNNSAYMLVDTKCLNGYTIESKERCIRDDVVITGDAIGSYTVEGACNTTFICNETEKVCRHKTLADLSCSELKTQYDSYDKGCLESESWDTRVVFTGCYTKAQYSEEYMHRC